MVKLQIIQSDEEIHGLSQDMARLMENDDMKDTIIFCGTEQTTPIKVHSWILRARSPKLASYLEDYKSEEDKVIISFKNFVSIQFKHVVCYTGSEIQIGHGRFPSWPYNGTNTLYLYGQSGQCRHVL